MKNQRIISAVFILIVGYLFIGCDKLSPPFIEQHGGNDTTNKVQQRVLVEYFTGHKCPNCPTAASQLKQLKELYPGKIIQISIHAGGLAMPIGQNYTTDYRTSVGDELYAYFLLSSVPNGLVNRKSYEQGLVLPPDAWAAAIAEELQKEPELDITFSSLNIAANQLQVQVKTEILKDMEGMHRLMVYIVEDSIQSYQKNSNSAVGNVPEIPDYMHRYVLRSSMNGTWGDTLFPSIAVQSEHFENNLTATLSSAWNKEHLYLIAIVADGTSDVVKQSAIVKVQ